MKLTAQVILAAWRTHPLNYQDAYGSDPEIRARLIDPSHDRPRIVEACDWIRAQWPDVGGYIDGQGYDWVVDPAAYELPTEAFWQMRALQQLSSLEGILTGAGMPAVDTGGVIIRQTFVTRYDLMSPRYRPWQGIHFIVLPQAYFDFASLIWSSFATWCAQGRPDHTGSWDATTRPLSQHPSLAADAWLLVAIARHIATPARDFDIHAVDAASLIAARVPFFAQADRDVPLHPVDPFLVHVSYVLADFAIAHELGHRTASHDVEISPEERLSKELEADGWGLDFFRASWGWRAEILEGTPFDDALQPVLGQLVFFHTTRFRGLLAQAVGVRAQKLGLPFLGIGWGEDEQRRAIELSKAMTAALQRVMNSGATVSDDAMERLGVLASNLSLFADHVIQVCLSIPEADLKAAIKIALELGPESLHGI